MSDDYLLGASDDELVRLGFQHETWAATTAALWDRARFRLGQTILDLGAGPGFASLALARRVGDTGNVIAMDSSDKAIEVLRDRAEHLGLNNVEANVADVAEFDVGPESVDGIFARWLFCFLPEPRALVERASRWLKPGGTFAVMDYFHYAAFSIAPPIDVMPRLAKAVGESWSSSGGSLDVGGHLPTWMGEAGLDVISVEPIVHCARPGSAMWHWPVTFFASYLGVLTQKGLLGQDDAKRFHEALQARARNPNAFLMTPPVLSIVARKPR